MSQEKRELRLFISSTFRDLIEEREELLKKVFPQLRHICRQRGIDFVEIDLRWGLTEQDSALGTVIRTCLEEVDRCRPFFLGILGSRYGWSPSFVDIQKDPELLTRYPWIEEAAIEGASILELEFTHALFNRVPATGAFVYHRDDSFIGEDGARLRKLATSVEVAGVPLREFDSVDALGRLVLEDLMNAINFYWPEPLCDDFLGRERREQAAFGSTRRKAYIANAGALRTLNAHVAPGSKPLVITAPSGQGKSALLAYWSEFIKRKQPETIVLTHFVGLSTAGSGAPAILRHFVEELRAQIGGPEEKLSPDSIESEFRIWLSRIVDRQIVFIVDAVNQLDEQWHSMEWLHETDRENIHWIVSTTGGPTNEALVQRGWQSYHLGELSVSEREALIVRFLGDFRKVLTSAQLERIAHCDNCASPLFLRTLLEELRLFGNFESLDQVIDQYMTAPDLAGLFQMVLGRMQEDFGAVRVREILTLIWAARKGLSESELVELTGVSKSKLTKFLLALEYQLLPRGGFITLFHDYLAQAIQRAYLPSREHEVKLHERLAKYFDEKELNDRNANELLWQLAQAGRLDRIRKLLVSPLHFRFFMTDERKWEYLRYWRMIDQDRELAVELATKLRTAAEQSYSHEEERIEQVSVGASFLHEMGQPQLSLELAEFAETKLAELPESFNSLRIQLLGIKGQAYQSLSDYPKAEEAFKEQIAEAEAEAEEGAQSLVLIDSLENLGGLYYLLARYDEARQCLEGAGSLLHKQASDARKAIEILMNLAGVYYAQRAYQDATTAVQQGISLCEHLVAPDLEMTLYNTLGAVKMAEERYAEAMIDMQRSVDLSMTHYGPHHQETLIRKGNIGWLMFLNGEAEQAAAYLTDLVDESERIFGPDNSRIGVLLINIAEVYTALRNYDLAALYGEKAEAVFSRSGMQGTLQYAVASLAAVSYLHSVGRHAEAQDKANKYLSIAQNTLGKSPIYTRAIELSLRREEEVV